MPKKVRKRIVFRKYRNRERAQRRAENKLKANRGEDASSGMEYKNEISEESGNQSSVPLSHLIDRLKESLKEGVNSYKRQKYHLKKTLTRRVVKEPPVESALPESPTSVPSSRLPVESTLPCRKEIKVKDFAAQRGAKIEENTPHPTRLTQGSGHPGRVEREV